MRGLYIPKETSFLELLKPMFARLDSLYWIVNCQNGLVDSLWLSESKKNESDFENQRIPVTAFDHTNTNLWKPGVFSKLKGGLKTNFDEWALFLGFPCAKNEEAIGKARWLWKDNFFTLNFTLNSKRKKPS